MRLRNGLIGAALVAAALGMTHEARGASVSADDCPATLAAIQYHNLESTNAFSAAQGYQQDADASWYIITTVPMEEWELQAWESIYYDQLNDRDQALDDADYHGNLALANQTYYAAYCS
jgi:hypothetical protein